MSTGPLTVAGALPFSVRTVPLADDEVGVLLEHLPRQSSVAWVTGGAGGSDGEQTGFVGWGEAARLEVSGPERFSRAQRWWADWVDAAEVEDPVRTAGSGPVAFASFAFDPAATTPSVVVVPAVLLARREGAAWLTVVGGDRRSASALLADTRAGLTHPVALPAVPESVRYSEGTRTVPQWRAAVAEAGPTPDRGRRAGQGGTGARHHGLLRRARPTFRATCCCGWPRRTPRAGRTPSMASSAHAGDAGPPHRDRVPSRVLAGTVRRSTDSGHDARSRRRSLASGKDLDEHEYAVKLGRRAALAPHCSDLTVPEHRRAAPQQRHAPRDRRDRRRSPTHASVLALAASLHPTAAVCGTPADGRSRSSASSRGWTAAGTPGRSGGSTPGDGEWGSPCAAAWFDDADPSTLRLYRRLRNRRRLRPGGRGGRSRGQVPPDARRAGAGTDPYDISLIKE